ncbi:MAG: redoxin family protein [Parvularculaceae bacterium]|nr:redoxin family protein [Parvularculaceae bacterium]
MKAVFAAVLSGGLLSAAAAMAAPTIGAPAPAFAGARTASGEVISLAQFKGRPVVLEWTNHDCPFVKKHYETGNMQKTQSAAKADGAVWISVISSAPGKQGHVTPVQAAELTKSRKASPDYVVLDESGEIGRAFGAKTTPDMFLVDKDGALRYAGAIDDKPTPNHASVDGAKNFLIAALGDVKSGKEVAVSQTKPYGCAVKY